MSFCANCGKSFGEGTQFCTACGSPVGAAATAAAAPPTLPDQAATQVMPPGADQTPTQVLPPTAGMAPGVTQIMPAGMVPRPVAPPAGPAGPPRFTPGYPPAGPPPMGYGMPTPPGGSSKKRLWIALGGAVAAIAVIAILVIVLNPFGCGGGKFEGNWWALDDSGGLIIGGGQQVWIVEPDGTKYGPLDGKVKGDTLQFKLSDAVIKSLPTDAQDQAAALAMVSFEAKFDKKTGHLFVTTSLAGDAGGLGSAFEPQTTEFKKIDVLPTQAPSETPSVFPTVSETPSTSPMPTDSGTPSTSPTPTVDPAKDSEVRTGADAIVAGIDASFADLGTYPANGTVIAGGALEGYLPSASWPVNPYTAAPMASGAGFGNYTYTLNADGSDYQQIGRAHV